MDLVALESKAGDTAYYNCVCETCGKKFHVKPYHLRRFKTHYCSKQCQNEARKVYMSGPGNHQYGLVGEKNATWSGGTKINRFGYRQIQAIGHPFAVGRSQYVLEHRLVAEKHLLTEENSVLIDGKKYLSPEYVVHHKNYDRLDNRPENLCVMTLSQHQSMHEKENIHSRNRDRYGRFVSGR